MTQSIEQSLHVAMVQYWGTWNYDPKILTQYSQDVLEDLFRHLSSEYYNDNEIVPDEVFDKLYMYMRKTYPNSLVITTEVRAAVRDDIIKVPLFDWMSSLDKAYDEKDLGKYLKRNKEETHVLSDKMDGFSLELSYDKKGNKKLVTGGDGFEGQDVSHLIPFLNLPEATDLVVRCEGIISKADFEVLKDTLKTKSTRDWKNARNMLSNVFNSKHPTMEIVSKIKVFALEVLHPSGLTPESGFSLLEGFGFTVPIHYVCTRDAINVENLTTYFRERKVGTKFDIDGVVLVANKEYIRVKKDNPKYAIAFKENNVENIHVVPVVNIHPNVSRTGRIIPQVELAPTDMQGVTVTFATGHNYGQIRDRNIGTGSIVTVTRSGDVIPYIIDVLEPTTAQLPPGIENVDWYWATDLDIAVIHHDNHPLGDTFRTQRIKELSYLAEKLNIDGIKEGTATKLYDAGINTYEKLLKVTPNQLLNIEGIGESTINNICDNIANVLSKGITLPQFAAATASFGSSIGQTKLENLSEFYDLNKIVMLDHYTRVQLIQGFNGFSEASATIISTKWDDMLDLATQCGVSFVEQIKEEVVSSNLSGLYAVFTGVRDKELEDYIIANGGDHGSSMPKATVLIMKVTGSGTSKEKKAIEKGIEIVTLEEFKAKYVK